jgi:hypothetical protein
MSATEVTQSLAPEDLLVAEVRLEEMRRAFLVEAQEVIGTPEEDHRLAAAGACWAAASGLRRLRAELERWASL